MRPSKGRINVSPGDAARFLLAMKEERLEDGVAIFDQYDPFMFACALAGGWCGQIAGLVGPQNVVDYLRSYIDKAERQ